MMTVYHIPAPDMDEKQIALVRADDLNIISLKLPPIVRNTTIDDLKNSLCAQIKDQNPILLGFCYGGLLVQEICKGIPGSKAIVVSSIISRTEISTSTKLAGGTFLYAPEIGLKALGLTLTLVINRVMRVPVKIPRVWRKVPQNKFIIRHSLDFDGIERERIFRIHGSSDRVVPIPKDVPVEKRIEGGGHFMFFQNKHKEVMIAIGDAAQKLAHRRARHV